MTQKKLHDCLITIGKEAEKGKIPTPEDLYQRFDRLMAAIDQQDMKAMGKNSRELAGALVKWMVEKL